MLCVKCDGRPFQQYEGDSDVTDPRLQPRHDQHACSKCGTLFCIKKRPACYKCGEHELENYNLYHGTKADPKFLYCRDCGPIPKKKPAKSYAKAYLVLLMFFIYFLFLVGFFSIQAYKWINGIS